MAFSMMWPHQLFVFAEGILVHNMPRFGTSNLCITCQVEMARVGLTYVVEQAYDVRAGGRSSSMTHYEGFNAR